MLHEEAWCKLETATDDFAVYVGYDLDMYIGSTEPCERAVDDASGLRVFVEPGVVSPHLPGLD